MEYDRYDLSLLVELDLYDEIKDIYFDSKIDAKIKEKSIKQSINNFFGFYKISNNQDRDFVFNKIEQMLKSEKELQKQRKEYDYEEGTR